MFPNFLFRDQVPQTNLTASCPCGKFSAWRNKNPLRFLCLFFKNTRRSLGCQIPMMNLIRRFRSKIIPVSQENNLEYSTFKTRMRESFLSSHYVPQANDPGSARSQDFS